jgi:hypothetical protein
MVVLECRFARFPRSRADFSMLIIELETLNQTVQFIDIATHRAVIDA